MNKGAFFDDSRVYRYCLYRIWGEPDQALNVIGLNPSTADETEDDNTIRRCIGFARAWGYGGLLMTNLYAYRATNPDTMFGLYGSKGLSIIGRFNDDWLANGARGAAKTLLAWSGDKRALPRQKAVWALLNRYRTDPLYCLGTTKDGHPRHPLYVRADKQPEVWVPPWLK